MSAKVIDIIIEQGSEYFPVFTWKDSEGNLVDLSLYEGKMDIREAKDKTSTLIHSVSTDNGDLLLSAIGTYRPKIPASVTDQFDFVWAWYDVEVWPSTNPEAVKKPSKGRVMLDKSVTD